MTEIFDKNKNYISESDEHINKSAIAFANEADPSELKDLIASSEERLARYEARFEGRPFNPNTLAAYQLLSERACLRELNKRASAD